MRTSESQYEQQKIKSLQKSLMELNYILKKELKIFLAKSKLSIDQVTYLLTNILSLLLKSYNYHFKCDVINIFCIIFTLDAELRSEGCHLSD